MSQIEPNPEQTFERPIPTFWRKLGAVGIVSSTCVGLAANIYVMTDDVPAVPRALLCLAAGLSPVPVLFKQES